MSTPQGQSAITVESRANLGTIANSFEKLDGKENVKKYFKKIERWGDLYNLSKAQLLKILQVKVEGDVAIFAETEMLLEPEVTYDEFKKKIEKRFTRKTLPGTAQTTLMACKQEKGESVNQFASRIKSLGLDMVEELTEQAIVGEEELIRQTCKTLILNQFKTGISRGVKKQIGLIFIREPDLSFEEAMDLATAAELNMAPDDWGTGDVVVVEERISDDEGIAFVKPQTRGFRSNRPRNENRPPLTCYNCYGVGHIAARCNRESRCRRCKKEGHIEKYCREREDKTRGWSTGQAKGGDSQVGRTKSGRYNGERALN